MNDSETEITNSETATNDSETDVKLDAAIASTETEQVTEEINFDSESETRGDTADIHFTLPIGTPLVSDIYTADPSAHVFNDRLYIYSSHDRDDATNDYNMVDYHVLSLSTDAVFEHHEILHVNDVPWAREKMWAPDAAYKDGTYYFYFPAKDHEGLFRIGVATSSSPTGPFTPESEPIEGSFSMDPAVFEDDDGTFYMYFGGLMGGQLECWRNETLDVGCPYPGQGETALKPRVAVLGTDMKSFNGTVKEVSVIDQNGNELSAADEQRRFFEALWMHKYQDTYYLSYSTGTTHLIVYATGDTPLGPFTYQGVILPDLNRGWTTHHSITEFQGEWYLFYHDNSLSGVDQKRCVKVAKLTHNTNGSIQSVRPD